MELELNGINADSLVQMLKASFTLENWEGILLIADKLYSEINAIYNANQRERAAAQKVTSFNLRRPVVYYFGYSMSLKGIAMEKKGRYAEARAAIDKYSDLSWIEGMDAAGVAEVEYYQQIAKANRYVIDLNEGNTDIIPDYIAFLRINEQELLLGLISILKAAINFKYNVDEILNEFQEKMSAMAVYYETQRIVRYYNDYIYLKAKYYSIIGKTYDSINTLLLSLTSSVKLNDNTGFRKSVALFENLRAESTASQLGEYKLLMQQLLA
ncbi:hypothetical protein [Paenibacillus borealis]|uniref:hypothetical protein n=1 Tax=Paenibacillus borealis TaxID=160799 RepID=UPI0009DE7E78|nr:hypothetical protein [Paenibacillus borealis]